MDTKRGGDDLLEKFGNRLKMTVGDSAYLEVSVLNDSDGNPLTPPEEYHMQDGDSVIFYMKRAADDEKPILAKVFTDMVIRLTPHDTIGLEPGKYLYFVQIVFANNDVNTVIDGEEIELCVGEHAKPTLRNAYTILNDSMRNGNRLVGRIKEYSHLQSANGLVVPVDRLEDLERPGKAGVVYFVKDNGNGAGAIYLWSDENNDYLVYGINAKPLNDHLQDFNNPHRVELLQVGHPLTNMEIDAILKM